MKCTNFVIFKTCLQENEEQTAIVGEKNQFLRFVFVCMCVTSHSRPFLLFMNTLHVSASALSIRNKEK